MLNLEPHQYELTLGGGAGKHNGASQADILLQMYCMSDEEFNSEFLYLFLDL